MRVPEPMLRAMRDRLLKIPQQRPPDEIIGPGIRSRLRNGHVPVPKEFLRRWLLVTKNQISNWYLHNFTRDDEDRALHDHPWWNLSILLDGSYIEHSIAAGGVHHRQLLVAGDMKLRAPWDAHRVECLKEYPSEQYGTSKQPIPCWSLFITGPVQHGWGFHCPGEWRSQRKFADEGGCGKEDYAPDGQLKGYHHDE